MTAKVTHEMSWGTELTTSLPSLPSTSGFRSQPSQCPWERWGPEWHQPSYSNSMLVSEPLYSHCNLLLHWDHGKHWWWEAVFLSGGSSTPMAMSRRIQYGYKACPHYPASGLEPRSSHENMPLQLHLSALWDLPRSAAWPVHKGARLGPRVPAAVLMLGVQRRGWTPSAVRGKVTLAAEVFPSTLSSVRRKPLRCDGVMRRSASPHLLRFWEPRLSPLPAFREAGRRSQHSTAPACSFHWNPRLLAIYILFLERDRKSNESEPSMVTSATAPTRLPAAPHALREIPTVGLMLCPPPRWGGNGPQAPQPAPSLLGWQVGTTKASRDPPDPISHNAIAWCFPKEGKAGLSS